MAAEGAERDRLPWSHEAALKAARILGKRDHKLGIPEDREPARRARGRHRDRQGRRPRGRPEREARRDGPERLRQVDPRLRAHGPPAYAITEGRIFLDGEDIVEAGADERAQKALFLAFQYPHAIPGVTVTSFLRTRSTRSGRHAGGKDDPIPVKEFRTEILTAMERLKVPRELARYLNDGFSGGEKKRVEILQMALLKPKIAVLDETDPGSTSTRCGSSPTVSTSWSAPRRARS